MLKDANSQLADAIDRQNLAIKERDDAVRDATAQVTAAQNSVNAANAARDKAIADAGTERAKVAAVNDQLAKQLDDKTKVHVGEVDGLKKENKALLALIDRHEQVIQNQKDKLDAMTTTSFEQPDGKIARVSQQERTVWINLGFADGLRRQQTFAIYNQNEADFQNAKPKGTIEVTIVKEAKLSEARIVSDQIADPILPGDLVFSPSWQPGQRLHFALAGFLDANGDGKSDTNLVKNLITLNGGIIDAEVNEQGERTGTVSIETRYLVVGDRPQETSSAVTLAAYTSIVKECENFGIEKISVDKLLSMMGYSPEVNTTQLGGRASGDDTGTKFRPRRPGDAYTP
jgi:hypothetical protein